MVVAKTWLSGLSDMEISQAKGIRKFSATMMSSASSSRTRPPLRQFSPCRPRAPTIAGPGAPVRSSTPSIVHPPCRTTQYEHRQGEGDDQEDPGQPRRVAHVQIGKCVLIEIERIVEGRVHRPTVGDDEGLGEELE